MPRTFLLRKGSDDEESLPYKSPEVTNDSSDDDRLKIDVPESDSLVLQASEDAEADTDLATGEGSQPPIIEKYRETADGYKEKYFECIYCGKEFKKRYLLKRHFPIHTGERRYICSVCNEGFSRASTLSRHKAIHKADHAFQCPVCNKRFNRSSSLKAHRKTHETSKDHICPHCGKGFHQKGNLKTHMFIHTGVKPYVCEHCKMGFNQISNLNVHVARMHRELRLVCCTLCGASFHKRKDLRQHELEAHYTTIKGKLTVPNGPEPIDVIDKVVDECDIDDTESHPEPEPPLSTETQCTVEVELPVDQPAHPANLVTPPPSCDANAATFDEHQEASFTLVKLHGSPKKSYLKPPFISQLRNKRKSETPTQYVNLSAGSKEKKNEAASTTNPVGLDALAEASTVDTSAIDIADKPDQVDVEIPESFPPPAKRTETSKSKSPSKVTSKPKKSAGNSSPQLSGKLKIKSKADRKKRFLDRADEKPTERPQQIVKHRIFKSRNATDNSVAEERRKKSLSNRGSGKNVGAKRKSAKAKQVLLKSSGSLDGIVGETQIRLCLGKGGKMIGYLKDSEGKDVLVNITPVSDDKPQTAAAAADQAVQGAMSSPSPRPPTPAAAAADRWATPSPSPRKLKRSRIVTNHSSDSDSDSSYPPPNRKLLTHPIPASYPGTTHGSTFSTTSGDPRRSDCSAAAGEAGGMERAEDESLRWEPEMVYGWDIRSNSPDSNMIQRGNEGADALLLLAEQSEQSLPLVSTAVQQSTTVQTAQSATIPAIANVCQTVERDQQTASVHTPIPVVSSATPDIANTVYQIVESDQQNAIVHNADSAVSNVIPETAHVYQTVERDQHTILDAIAAELPNIPFRPETTAENAIQRPTVDLSTLSISTASICANTSSVASSQILTMAQASSNLVGHRGNTSVGQGGGGFSGQMSAASSVSSTAQNTARATASASVSSSSAYAPPKRNIFLASLGREATVRPPVRSAPRALSLTRTSLAVSPRKSAPPTTARTATGGLSAGVRRQLVVAERSPLPLQTVLTRPEQNNIPVIPTVSAADFKTVSQALCNSVSSATVTSRSSMIETSLSSMIGTSFSSTTGTSLGSLIGTSLSTATHLVASNNVPSSHHQVTDTTPSLTTGCSLAGNHTPVNPPLFIVPLTQAQNIIQPVHVSGAAEEGIELAVTETPICRPPLTSSANIMPVQKITSCAQVFDTTNVSTVPATASDLQHSAQQMLDNVLFAGQDAVDQISHLPVLGGTSVDANAAIVPATTVTAHVTKTTSGSTAVQYVPILPRGTPPAASTAKPYTAQRAPKSNFSQQGQKKKSNFRIMTLYTPDDEPKQYLLSRDVPKDAPDIHNRQPPLTGPRAAFPAHATTPHSAPKPLTMVNSTRRVTRATRPQQPVRPVSSSTQNASAAPLSSSHTRGRIAKAVNTPDTNPAPVRLAQQTVNKAVVVTTPQALLPVLSLPPSARSTMQDNQTAPEPTSHVTTTQEVRVDNNSAGHQGQSHTGEISFANLLAKMGTLQKSSESVDDRVHSTEAPVIKQSSSVAIEPIPSTIEQYRNGMAAHITQAQPLPSVQNPPLVMVLNPSLPTSTPNYAPAQLTQLTSQVQGQSFAASQPSVSVAAAQPVSVNYGVPLRQSAINAGKSETLNVFQGYQALPTASHSQGIAASQAIPSTQLSTHLVQQQIPVNQQVQPLHGGFGLEGTDPQAGENHHIQNLGQPPTYSNLSGGVGQPMVGQPLQGTMAVGEGGTLQTVKGESFQLVTLNTGQVVAVPQVDLQQVNCLQMMPQQPQQLNFGPTNQQMVVDNSTAQQQVTFVPHIHQPPAVASPVTDGKVTLVGQPAQVIPSMPSVSQYSGTGQVAAPVTYTTQSVNAPIPGQPHVTRCNILRKTPAGNHVNQHSNSASMMLQMLSSKVQNTNE